MKKSIATLAALLAASTAMAEAPLWTTYPRISPDGKQIAFCYKGDIYKVPTYGGAATRLTSQSSFETRPAWSPDGKQIAFSSDRFGGFDVFVMPSNGGTATRLTSNSAVEYVTAFTPDGKNVLFNACIQDPSESALFPSGMLTELYQVPATGGATTQLLATPAEFVCYSPDGNSFLYQDRKSVEDEWRKHHTSSATRDIWSYDIASGKHTNLTHRGGEDRNPVYSPDGKQVYFLSERNGGSLNLYSFPIDNPSNVKAITSFSTNPMRFLSIAADGTMCYTYNGEIYTQTPNGQPQKVAIDVVCDDEPDFLHRTYGSGASEVVPSPDGKQVALVIRGEVFVTSVDYSTTKAITHTAQRETQVDWAPDNRTIAYASERDGVWNIYTAKIARSDDPNFANATVITEEALFPASDVERTQPVYSPDGKELAFIENRRTLKVMNLASKAVRTVAKVPGWENNDDGQDFSWSPDGKWFTLNYISNGRSPFANVGIVSSKGGEITDLTGSAFFNMSPRWVLDGNAIMFLTDRYGMRSRASWGSQYDVAIVFLNKDAFNRYNLSKEDYELLKEVEKQNANASTEKTDSKKSKKNDKKKADSNKKEEKSKDIVVELDGVNNRIVRVTSNSGNISDAVITKDGDKLYYLASNSKGSELWSLNLREHDLDLVKKGSGWNSLDIDKDGNLFIIGSSIQKMTIPGNKTTNVTYSANVKIDRAAEREYMFNHVCTQEDKCFYNLNMHGVDWPAMTANYRRFLPHINNNYDFAQMLSEMLGELNVSHTGSRYSGSYVEESTAELGLLYDWSFTGNGKKVSEVLVNGPFDRENSKVKAGCIIEKINGEEITPTSDISLLLNNANGKKTLVSIYNPSNGSRWDEVVLPISKSDLNELLYKRWVDARAADVDRLSGGRLGYVHIRSMNDASYRAIYQDLLGKYYKKDGIVIDTRFNGGGRLHEDIEVLFSGEKYLTQVIRGEEVCDMPSYRWNKPSIMLQCESNYSNAHGTPWVYKRKNMGSLVGAPVPGTMTSVRWETLQDPSIYFGIPIIGYQLEDGSYLENKQLEPDFLVLNAPETVVKGTDTQLKVAVDELLKQIDSKKK